MTLIADIESLRQRYGHLHPNLDVDLFILAERFRPKLLIKQPAYAVMEDAVSHWYSTYRNTKNLRQPSRIAQQVLHDLLACGFTITSPPDYVEVPLRRLVGRPDGTVGTPAP